MDVPSHSTGSHLVAEAAKGMVGHKLLGTSTVKTGKVISEVMVKAFKNGKAVAEKHSKAEVLWAHRTRGCVGIWEGHRWCSLESSLHMW